MQIVRTKIEEGAKIVDVRTSGEFAGGHYPNAVNIPLQEISSRLSEFGAKTKPVIVYCASGARSGSAKSMLEENGFTDVTNGGSVFSMPR